MEMNGKQYTKNLVLQFLSVTLHVRVIREVKQNLLGNAPAGDSRPNCFGISLSYWINLFLIGRATSCVAWLNLLISFIRQFSSGTKSYNWNYRLLYHALFLNATFYSPKTQLRNNLLESHVFFENCFCCSNGPITRERAISINRSSSNEIFGLADYTAIRYLLNTQDLSK